jgi:hypothetical protein
MALAPAKNLLMDDFIPPVCSDAQVLKEGFVELHLQGFPPSALPPRKPDLE